MSTSQTLIVSNFRTPLHVSVMEGAPTTFSSLLSRGASTEIKSDAGFPPLWYALVRMEGNEGDATSYAEELVRAKASTSVVRKKKNRLLEKEKKADNFDVSTRMRKLLFVLDERKKERQFVAATFSFL